MRRILALLAYVTAVTVMVAACGARTGIGDAGGSLGGGGASSSSSTTSSSSTASSSSTTTSSSSTTTSSSSGGCGLCPAATTCAGKGFDCGIAGDGCGCLLHCGTCTQMDATCGGSGTPNVCGPPCVPKTCGALGLDCGKTGDGCDGEIFCGDCPGGQYCGGGMTGDTCGFGPTCKTCAQQGFDCGTMDDGCGNAIPCGTCPSGTICGGGSPGKPGVCGAPICVPKTCMQQSFDCGKATDGCGGIIDCGFCSGNQICGEKAPNACGASGTCTGLCLQQVACPGGGTTSVTGTVFAPNGADPLYGTLVYVPNAPVQPFTPGVACGDCTSQVTGAPLVSAVTGVDGTFTLNNMPVGANIPLVIQNGRWRRQFVIPNVAKCVSTALPAGGMPQIRMPQTKAEGDIPLMAFVTGYADTLECGLRKIGVADSEFSDPSGSGRIRFYQGEQMGGSIISGATPGEDQLWGSQAAIDAYDMVYFACQGKAYSEPAGPKQVLVDYANAGGRIFATHYSYAWLFDNGPFATTAAWDVNQPTNFANDPGVGLIDTTFPKGLALAQWLQVLYPTSTLGQIPINTLRHDFDGVNPPSLLWIHVDDPNYPGHTPMHLTFDTPVGANPAAQCGRVLYDDFHIEDAMTGGAIFPQECAGGPMTPQEKLLEFMIFDLGACVKLDACKVAQTCAEQKVQCGPAGDGCGNILQCGNCPAGQLCVGGTCVGCTPKTCAEQGFTCGAQSDACSGSLMCGTCPPNLVCLNGTCGPGICNAKTCAQQGFVCGPQGDGCGSLMQCGTCPTGQFCAAGHCQSVQCLPKSCAQQGFDCGLASDGCDNVIDCGTCGPPQVCGGAAGQPNRCAL